MNTNERIELLRIAKDLAVCAMETRLYTGTAGHVPSLVRGEPAPDALTKLTTHYMSHLLDLLGEAGKDA